MAVEDLPQEIMTHEIEPPASWPANGQVKFDDMSVRYRPKTDLVLKNLSFTVAPGHKVGVCGRTGTGKSTLGLTLSRILEFDGRILIDNLDIAKIDLHLLREKVTVIP